ncbi:hypothetical protein GQ457_11G009030 [Hibiscus cannabinus]
MSDLQTIVVKETNRDVVVRQQSDQRDDAVVVSGMTERELISAVYTFQAFDTLLSQCIDECIGPWLDAVNQVPAAGEVQNKPGEDGSVYGVEQLDFFRRNCLKEKGAMEECLSRMDFEGTPF